MDTKVRRRKLCWGTGPAQTGGRVASMHLGMGSKSLQTYRIVGQHAIHPHDFPPKVVWMMKVHNPVWHVSPKSPICVQLGRDLVIVKAVACAVHHFHAHPTIPWFHVSRRWGGVIPQYEPIYDTFKVTILCIVTIFTYIRQVDSRHENKMLPIARKSQQFLICQNDCG